LGLGGGHCGRKSREYMMRAAPESDGRRRPELE
jgi:hypothetical protein